MTEEVSAHLSVLISLHSPLRSLYSSLLVITWTWTIQTHSCLRVFLFAVTSAWNDIPPSILLLAPLQSGLCSNATSADRPSPIILFKIAITTLPTLFHIILSLLTLLESLHKTFISWNYFICFLFLSVSSLECDPHQSRDFIFCSLLHSKSLNSIWHSKHSWNIWFMNI